MTDNHGIHAVPPPNGEVVIDGKLDDWDLSGQVFICYDVENLTDIYSAKVAAMYDAENLYIAIQWADRTPMGNIHNPHYQADKAWAGDAVQLRIKTDRISHVLSWYYAARQEPSIYIDYGRDLKTPFKGPHTQLFQVDGWKLSEGAETAFRKNEDGKGYVQEIKLPWKLITESKHYQPGESLCMGFELLWGERDWPAHRFADNLALGATSREFFYTNIDAWGSLFLEPKGKLSLPTPEWKKGMGTREVTGPVEITYILPEDSRVTLAIEDPAGKRIRNLIPALPRLKGANTEHWDGLDDNGKVVPPGKYVFKALRHQGLHTTYLASFANPGNPTWETPDNHGSFYGDHTPPQAVAAAGDVVALACPMAEAGKQVIGCDLTGQRLWGLAGRAFLDYKRIVLATDGKFIWVGADLAGSIYRVEAATGIYTPWNRHAKDNEGRDYKVLDLPIFDASALLADLSYSSLTSANLRAIAVNGSMLAVVLNKENVVKLLDKETGDVQHEIRIDEPQAGAFDQDGSLILLAKGALVRATAAGKISPFAKETFPEGYSLAIDSKRKVYLSVRGQDQNVKVFSADGKKIAEIGKRGGRPLQGKFIDEGMRNPAGIAIDSQDRLWVTEETQNPKRTSLWSTTNGKLIRDFVGSTSYCRAGSINPFDPTMAFSDETVYQLDIAKGTSRPTWSLGAKSGPDDLFPPRVHALTNRVIQHHGTTYVYTAGGAHDVGVFCTQYKNGQWRSVAAIGVVCYKTDRTFREFQIHWSPLFEGHEGEMYSWTDLNGDGLVQANELKFATPLGRDPKGKPVAVGCPYWGELPDDDGTLAFNGANANARPILKFPIASYGPGGEPVYDIEHPKVIEPEVVGSNLNMSQGGKGGRLFLNQNPLTGIDKNGKVIFTYPSQFVSVHGSHKAPSSKPGLLIGPSSFLGTADMGGDIGEVFYLNGNLGENYLFTWDGLFIQTLFKDCRGGYETPEKAARNISWDNTTAGGESFGGNFIRTSDGKVYLTNGTTDARVIEITGLSDIKRFSGQFTYTEEQHAQARQQQEAAMASKWVAQTYKIAKAAGPVAMGGADSWPELRDSKAKLIEIQEDPSHRFGRVAARYDANRLYLAYLVLSGSPLRNVGQEAQMLFKTGDAVDLMLGPVDASKPGNLRLLFSEIAGRPTAVLYEKTVPGTPENARVPFSSPSRSIYFDRVTQPSEIQTSIKSVSGGYLVEASVPWSVLGVQPASGLKLRGDFGILGADKGGTVTVSRRYWTNKATNLVNDVPGEADLEPKLWGNLVLE
ncbi:MAG: FlgD immunoglobulin-like domain containing protein [Chthoniobacteraceae bacterium]